MRLKLNRIVSLPARKRCRCRAEVNTLVNLHIRLRVDSVLLQNIFKDHLRHTARSSAEHTLSLQHIPGKVVCLFPCHKKISGALCQLRKIDYIVLRSPRIGIDRALASHEADIRLSRQHRRHGLIRAKARDKLKVDAFLSEISLLDCHIHRRIKYGMCHLVQRNLRPSVR